MCSSTWSKQAPCLPVPLAMAKPMGPCSIKGLTLPWEDSVFLHKKGSSIHSSRAEIQKGYWKHSAPQREVGLKQGHPVGLLQKHAWPIIHPTCRKAALRQAGTRQYSARDGPGASLTSCILCHELLCRREVGDGCCPNPTASRPPGLDPCRFQLAKISQLWPGFVFP